MPQTDNPPKPLKEGVALDTSKKTHMGRSNDEGITLLWKERGSLSEVLQIEKEYVLYENGNKLEVLTLVEGDKQALLKKRNILCEMRRGKVWVQNKKGYDLLELPTLVKSGSFKFPAARDDEGALDDAVYRSIYQDLVYRVVSKSVGDEEHSYLQGVDLAGGEQVFFSKFPILGMVEELAVDDKFLWVGVWPSQNVHHLLILDRESGALVHQQETAGEPRFHLGENTLVSFDGVWHRFDEKQPQLVACKAIPEKSRLKIIDAKLYALTSNDLLRLKQKDKELIVDAEAALAKSPKTLFKFRTQIGCLVPQNNEGDHTLVWLKPDDLSEVGRSNVIFKKLVDPEVHVMGNHLVVAGEGVMCLSMPGGS